MGFPLDGYPPIVKTWEWSADVTIRVSASLVAVTAFSTASAKTTVSVNDL